MSDPYDPSIRGDAAPGESEGLGAADPITGVTAAADDLDDDAQLPDSDEDADAAAEGDPSEADYAAGDPEAAEAEAMDTVTSDAVAGETVLPGPGDGNDGPTGGAPTEEQPELPRNELDPTKDVEAEPIDLRDEA